MFAGRSFNIKTDAIDTRDYIYRPSLQVLAPRFLCAVLDNPVERDNRTLRIRDQQQRSTCVGEALAALIDIQRYENGARTRNGEAAVSFVPTSAAMLDGMARSIEMGEAGATAGVLSLRSALRGFYNCGVATQADWPDESAITFDQITDSIAESARQLGLGAYYRLENVLNDYHAALHEAGAILVSASIHEGWAAPPDGMIGIGSAGTGTMHAFVVVGYTQDGFLVLNSFGPDWGGYKFDGVTPLPGVALWSYEDWAGSVRDAWVLRLAVPTPGSFRFTVGSYGKSAERGGTSGAAAITRSDAPRRNAVIGRYLTFEEGRFNDSGVYPTTRKTVDTTLGILDRRDSNSPTSPYYGDVVLMLHGAPEPAEDAIARTEAKIVADKADGIYRVSVLWANTLFNGAAAALQPLFEMALERRGKVGPECDELIERMTRPVGRAIWHEVGEQARRLAAPRDGKPSDLVRALSDLGALCAGTGRRLHIVAEGAGALAAGRLVSRLAGSRSGAAFLDRVRSVQLVAPTLSREELVDWFAPVLGKKPGGAPLVTVFKPDEGLERRLAVGPYSRSWLALIQSSFADDGTELISLASAAAIRHPGVREMTLRAPAGGGQQPLPLSALLGHADVDAFLRSNIRAARMVRRPGTVATMSNEPGRAPGALHAIHIGVDRLNPAYYGALPQLEGCVNDARAFAALSERVGCTHARVLADEEATRAAILAAIHQEAQELQAGDTLLITYSGHGNTAQDVSGDEASGLDSTWCVHDGEIVDDELAALWGIFRDGVNVVVISDSCHSGSVIAAPRPDLARDVRGRGAARRLPVPAESFVIRNRRLQARRPLADIVGTEMAARRVAASVTLLSACLDDQLAFETDAEPKGGLFTRAVLSALEADPALSATRLHAAATRAVSGQSPNLMRLGAFAPGAGDAPLFGVAPEVRGEPDRQERRKPLPLMRPRGLVSSFLAFPYDAAFNLDLTLLGELGDAKLAGLIGNAADVLSRLGRTAARVFVDGTRVGSGFIVSPSLIATNAHVASLFAIGREWNNLPVRFELAEGPFNPFPVSDQPVEIAWMPPMPSVGDPGALDLALVRLPAPLPSAPAGVCDFAASCAVDDAIAVIGFPGKAKGNTRTEVEQRFRGQGIGNYYDHMWLSPGYVRYAPGTAGPGSFIDPNKWIARYDANTTPGNSGSMVVSLTTNRIIGIHFANERWLTNFGYMFSGASRINPDVLQLIEEDYAAHNRVRPVA